jgi:hypothetical protein
MAASSKKSLVVTAPLVRVEDEGGRFQYLYRGASLDGVAAGEVDRLVGLDMAGEDKDGVVDPNAAAPHPTADGK